MAARADHIPGTRMIILAELPATRRDKAELAAGLATREKRKAIMMALPGMTGA